jgi:spore coat-associated protein N
MGDRRTARRLRLTVGAFRRTVRGRRLLGVLLVLLWLFTGERVVLASALFNKTGSVGANTFVGGTVDLSASPATALLTLAQMGPGDVLTAPVTVTNTGGVQLRYAITSTTSENPLAGQLDLYVKSGVTTCTTAGFGGSGTTIYNDTSHLGSTTGVNLAGNPSQGAQAGDRVLNAGANETLCFQVSMPTTIANTYHSITDTVTFTFAAEQTPNN